MINLAVISVKDIIKSLKKIIVFILILLFIINCTKILKTNFKNSFIKKINYTKQIKKIINQNILISKFYDKEKNQTNKNNFLGSELAILSHEYELMEKENQEELEKQNLDNTKIEENINNNTNNEKINNNFNNENSNNVDYKNIDNETNNKENVELIEIPENLETQIIEANNKTDKHTDIYKSVKIKNESKYKLTEEIVKPNIDFINKKNIIIYHTHTCESYTPTQENNYSSTGNYRTTDLNFSVSRVGLELENNLKKYNFDVLHDSTYHDYPAYTGSYTRALSTITNTLEKTKAELVIDLHRDALGNNSSYAPKVKIGDEMCAQLMFVIGSDGGGLEHKEWQKNLKYAIKIQEKANEMYPGLFKPIILRNSRYNQHVTSGACIIEVGATGNTLEECISSMKYLSKVIEKVME